MTRPPVASPLVLADVESEDGFCDAVIGLARWERWRVTHFRPGRTSYGWRTPIIGDKGWPDIFAVRGTRAVAAELKIGRRRAEPAQQAWLEALGRIPGIEVYLWRPADWPAIREVLGR